MVSTELELTNEFFDKLLLYYSNILFARNLTIETTAHRKETD